MRIHILDVSFDKLTIPELFQVVSNAIREKKQSIMGTHNLHSVYIFHHDSQFREYYEKASTIHIDGMALVYLARLLGFPLRREHRVTYLDWIFPLMEESASQNWRLFYLGGKPGVAEKAAQQLRGKYAGLQLETHHGFFNRDNSENQSMIETINSFRPDILMVGMGMPTQEHWILQNYAHLTPCVIMAPGACFDYLAGEIPVPPRWIGQIGFEWLFRLASEPKRLWKRYLLEPWYIVFLTLKELFHFSPGKQ